VGNDNEKPPSQVTTENMEHLQVVLEESPQTILHSLARSILASCSLVGQVAREWADDGLGSVRGVRNINHGRRIYLLDDIREEKVNEVAT
jgi:hypothetical protein